MDEEFSGRGEEVVACSVACGDGSGAGEGVGAGGCVGGSGREDKEEEYGEYKRDE